MKSPCALSVILSLTFLYLFSACIEIDLFAERKVVIEGHVYEAYDKSRPVEGVLVEGCTKKASLFPSHRDCQTETLTDSEGYFYLSFTADGLEGASYRFILDLYDMPEPCDTLADGTLECYVTERETFFVISGSGDVTDPVPYDSVTLYLSTAVTDTTLYYVTSDYTYIDHTYYHWAPRSQEQARVSDRFKVPDNSEASYKAVYYKEASEVLTESDTVLCSKGYGHIYNLRTR